MRTSSRTLRHLVSLAALVVLSVSACGGDAAPGGGDIVSATDLSQSTDDAYVFDGSVLDTPSPDSPAAPTTAEVRARGPWGVGVRTLALVDETRPMPPNGTFTGADRRPLQTELWYPAPLDQATEPRGSRDAPVAASDAPFPLIIYAHGFMTRGVDNVDLVSSLASRGYIVAGLDFPLTGMNAPGGANAADVENQPGDVSFVIDRVLALGADPEDPLHGAIDADRVGVFGVSLGGMTALLLGFYGPMLDPRVRVVATAAAPICYLQDSFFDERTIPLLLLHGDMDEVVDFEANAPRGFELAAAPAFLIRFHRGTHTGFGSIAGSVLDTMDNADLVGCAAVSGNPSLTASALADLAQQLGGRDRDVVLATCPAPCDDDDDLPLAMKSSRQAELMRLTIPPFFEAYLGGRPGWARYLTEVLPLENDDVSVSAR